ncbi:MAG: phosphate transport system regulatory protein PhoU, partial [Chloroflexi bacterium]|nr:phosphate transport system regulatory protein PhoU [Chloroflexota bacterium]
MLHPRETFDRQLAEMRQEILVMGQMIEEALERAVRSLKDRDLDLARQIIQDDAQINEQRFKIEDLCFGLIATQQPAARDLRDIISAMIVVNEMERMGDHA